MQSKTENANPKNLQRDRAKLKLMKLQILATVVLAQLCLIAPAKAYLPQDLEQLKQTGDCPRCDLSGAPLNELNNQLNLAGANLRDANLNRANMSQVNLEGADLSGANLEIADLSGAILTGASLTGVNFKSANLQDANLTRAGMIATNLEGANLKGAKMLFTNFRGAKFRLTTMPNGSVTPDRRYW